MSKIILIALITLTLSGCYNTDSQKPEATYPTPHTQGAIITKEGSVIFYHNIWGDIMRNLGIE